MTMYDDDRVVALLREVDLPLSPPDRLGEVRRRARGHDSRRMTALAGLMALVLVAGVVSALSLHTRGGTEQLTVADAANATAAARTARVTIKLSFSGPSAAALGGDQYTLSGPVDFQGRRFALKGSFGGRSFEMRGIGKDRWTTPLGLVGKTQPGLAGKEWLHGTGPSTGFGGFDQIDPTKLLDVLTKNATQESSKVVGDRTLLTLRVPANVLGDASDRSGPLDVTISVDSDRRVRLLTTTLVKIGASSPDVTATLAFDDFGMAVDVKPPPPDKVAEEADLSRSAEQQGFSVGPSSSTADRQKACAQFASFKKQRPAARTEQEKQQLAQFDEMMKQICGS
jgi:hypothetical protein